MRRTGRRVAASGRRSQTGNRHRRTKIGWHQPSSAPTRSHRAGRQVCGPGRRTVGGRGGGVGGCGGAASDGPVGPIPLKDGLSEPGGELFTALCAEVARPVGCRGRGSEGREPRGGPAGERVDRQFAVVVVDGDVEVDEEQVSVGAGQVIVRLGRVGPPMEAFDLGSDVDEGAQGHDVSSVPGAAGAGAGLRRSNSAGNAST